MNNRTGVRAVHSECRGARALALAFVALTASVVPAFAGTVDPVLRELTRRHEAPDLARGESRRLSFPGVAVESVEGTPFVRTVVEVDGRASREMLESVPGARVGTNEGGLATVRLPLHAIDALAATPGVRSVRAARRLEPQLERAAGNVRLSEAWAGSFTWTGRGVVIGIVDSGLDVAHGDLRQPDGSTRVLSVWDLDRDGDPPAGFGGGRYVDRNDIDLSLQAGGTPAVVDSFLHGTHVIGCAAGNGAESNLAVRRGVATEAEIVAVTAAVLFEDQAIDGLRFLVSEAARVGRPLVAIFAFTTQFGPHDGSTPLEREIERLEGLGATIVLAAGNAIDGRDPLHATIPAGGAKTRMRVRDVDDDPVSTSAGVTFWHPGDARPVIDYGITRMVIDEESGDPVPVDSILASVAPGEIWEGWFEERRVWIDNASAGLDPFNGDHNTIVLVEAANWLTGEEGEFFFEFRSDATGHGWVYGGDLRLVFPDGDDLYTLGMPATSRGGIVAGASRNRHGFVSESGASYFGPSQDLLPTRARAIFSSRGPTRDERRKPDVLAPGSFLVAPLSTTVSDLIPDYAVTAGRGYVVLEGTSQAAGVAAGVIAMMLEKNPNLSPARIRQILQDTALVDDFVGSTWNDAYGYGGIDALSALAAVPRPLSFGGDVDRDGRVTVGDVVTLARHIVDPNGRPLESDARDAADVVPAPDGDGILDARDVGRVLGLVLDENGLARTASGHVAWESEAPRRTDAGWVRPVVFRGDRLAAVQCELHGAGIVGAPFANADVTAFTGGTAERRRVLAFATPGSVLGSLEIHVPVDGPEATVRVASVVAADPSGGILEPEADETSTVLELAGRPNPSAGPMSVYLRLSRATPVAIDVFDLRGRRVAQLHQGNLGAGEHTLSWSGQDDAGVAVAGGTYFLRVDAGGEAYARKVTLQR